MPANLENSAVATGLEKGQFSFQPQRKVKVTQSCPTLYDPMDYTVRGIL